MQPPFSCIETTYRGLEGSLSPARLGRYLAGASGDKHYALRLYVWNGRLCEALYLPTQIAEVCVRNAIHRALIAHHGSDWFLRGGFRAGLPARLREELEEVIRRIKGKYGAAMTADRIVAGLSFGFWVHLLTKNYDGVLWPKYYSLSFPNRPNGMTRSDIHDELEFLRHFRNRMAHHKPVFDRSLKPEYLRIASLIGIICSETQWFTSMITKLDQAISAKPRLFP